MKFFKLATLLSILEFWAVGSIVFAAAPGPDLLKARGEAEAKGFIFETRRDEIVAKAKKEGRVRVMSAMEPDTYPHIVKAFKQQYPFIDISLEEITGTDAVQRFLLELQAGTARDWDVFRVSTDLYDSFAVHAKKIDLLGMAEHGVLRIPPKMIDPRHRSIIHAGSALGSTAYNGELISEDRVPSTWEDFLKPEFKGRKFLVDIRLLNFAPLAAGLGEEWMVNYARGLREQQPVWARGHTRALASMTAGEYGLFQLTNYHSCASAQKRDRRKVLVCKLIEPIPVRLSVQQAIVNNAPRPYAAILFLEFLASPEAQRILDEIEPLKSSIYAPGSELEKATRGKKLAVMDTFEHTTRWIKMAVEALGFPKAR
ncbi:MAG: extracellular solute-binding protein [Deltaproteobacteria bacterium]|nr:extracellular solute-binding protein [Deltaproteobacteria bacterium]